MAKNKQGDELFDLLRERGVRKKVAKSVARLESDGADGEGLARKAVEDLDAAAGEIRKRVLRTGATGSRRARTGASTRPRKATARKAAKRKATTRKATSRRPTTRKAIAKKTGRTRTRARSRSRAR